MPLIFPSNPSTGQTYQSGSSATFVYNGEAWDVQSFGVVSVTSASFAATATTASHAIQTATSSYLETTPTFAQVARLGSGQTINSGSIIIWNSFTGSGDITCNTSTGIFSVSRTGHYYLQANLQVAQDADWTVFWWQRVAGAPLTMGAATNAINRPAAETAQSGPTGVAFLTSGSQFGVYCQGKGAAAASLRSDNLSSATVFRIN